MNQFKIFDRIFWLIWLAFPITVWMTIQAVFSESPLMSFVPETCRTGLPVISNFSMKGKGAVALYILWQFVGYAVTFWLAHRTIRRCMRGAQLVGETLRTLGIIGIVVTAWAFVQTLTSNMVNYALTLTGDLKAFVPEYTFDVGLPALGILILAMRAVIAHAITLKQDHDLTI